MGIRKKNNLSELELHLRMSLLMKVDLLSNYLGTKILITIIFIDTTPHLQKTIRNISVPLRLQDLAFFLTTYPPLFTFSMV